MHLTYDKQLEAKRQRVIDAFERIGQLKEVAISPCLASPSPLAYRNKIQMPVQNGPNGEIVFGLYAKGSHTLVEVDHCEIHCPLGEKIFQSTSSIIKEFSSLKAYEYKSREGSFRHLLIKSALHSQQGLVILVTTGPKTDEMVAIAEKLLLACPEVKGVVHNRNDRHDNVILGEEYTLLAGVSSIEEQLCGLMFKISPASFFQVNPKQTEKMYEQAVAFAGLTGKETVLDAYCGVGTLALIFAKKANQVIGIECVKTACKDAEENAALNGINNVEFICDDVKKRIKKLADVDVVVLNPPRQGCEAEVIQQVASLKPDTIIYISCDPATLARDLALLLPLGYAIAGVQPFDMFPQTAHVETVVKIIKA
jgi:23S rRNA (uracil1939-C5)-methyltransferase